MATNPHLEMSPSIGVIMKALQTLVNQVVTMDGKVQKERLEMWADQLNIEFENPELDISGYLRYLATMVERED